MKNTYKLAIVTFSICVLGRLISHIPNVTPLTALCLLSNSVFPKRLGILTISASCIFSDYLLHFITGYPAFGSWTFFTYSGWAFGLLIGNKKYSFNTFFHRTIFFTLGFWIWTNFGSWIFSHGMYNLTLSGLVQCYTAGLPFLRNALIGNLLWGFVFYFSKIFIKKQCAHTPYLQ